MKLARSLPLAAVLLVLAGAGAFACASKERKATSAALPGDGPSAARAEPEGAVASTPEEPPAPPDPFAGISGDPAVGFDGAEQLLEEALGERLELPAFHVACVRGEDALKAPAAVDARLEALALEQEISLGRVRFVRIESDPAEGRAYTRLCRPVREDALLHAPLFREKEPPASWLVEAAADVPTAVRTLLDRAAKAQDKAAGPPRAIVVRGQVVGVALPVVREGA